MTRNTRLLFVFIGAFIFILSMAIGSYYNNPYPCSMSCVGCHNLQELLNDTWSDIVMMLGMILGFILIITGLFGVFEEKKEIKKK